MDSTSADTAHPRFSMQVINANHAVSALQVSTNAGQTWQTTTRRDYNYFEKPDGGGFGTDTVTLRVTCENGGTVTLQGVGVNGGSTVRASGNC